VTVTMFSNFFQSVKEITHGPSVQDGQKIRKSSDASITAKAVTLDEDGEMTEEGFVSIGRSSFICPSSDPIYPPLIGMETMTTSIHQMQMPMPFGQTSHLGQAPPTYQMHNHANFQTHPSLEFGESVRNVPMVLHPRLSVPMYDPKNPTGVTSTSYQITAINFSEFNYDFEFERGVLRDIDQQMDISNYSNEDNNANTNPNWTADWVNFD